MTATRIRQSVLNTGFCCADCSEKEPSWASINRGVLVCTECCTIHRSLGRTVSHVRSLRKSYWNANQLALVHALYSSGSNNIWEHTLLEPSGASERSRRKPTPKDPLYPVKDQFIRTKYEQMSFALRASRDVAREYATVEDLNRQLFSCVRTGHVDTTLRLLVLGASPCQFVDPHTGTTPIHVAAREGQELQVELLFLYGADCAQPDFDGLSPADHARAGGHADLAARLVELQYEMTDRLSLFLCGRLPDHQTGQHFLIPEVSKGQFETNRAARHRLHSLSDSALEKLFQDVYDEADRRDVDSAWVACIDEDSQLSNERYAVPFLPVSSDLAAPRNQRRQKLAKFNGREFASLIIDLLKEAKRRQTQAEAPEEPAAAAGTEQGAAQGDGNKESVSTVSSASDERVLSKTEPDGPIYDEVPSEQNAAAMTAAILSDKQLPESYATEDDVLSLKFALSCIERRFDDLCHSNEALRQEVALLRKVTEELKEENRNIAFCLSKLMQSSSSSYSTGTSAGASTTGTEQNIASTAVLEADRTTDVHNGRAVAGALLNGESTTRQRSVLSEQSFWNNVPNSLLPEVVGDFLPDTSMVPFPDNLVLETEALTKEIYHILEIAQSGTYNGFASLVIRVQFIVDRMIKGVPMQHRTGPLLKILNSMRDTCVMLSAHCATSCEASTAEKQQQDNFSRTIIGLSYEIARSANQLMKLFKDNQKSD